MTMPNEVARIPVVDLKCQGCNCGACVTDAIASIKAIDGVVYVGVDRLRSTFVVRYDGSAAEPEELRSAITDVGLSLE
jgi:copper chaperone CopZ